jgi:pimeloyl-ACP methyl ester carboxylesterase
MEKATKDQADRTDQQMKLRDGRRLGYDEYGHPDGKPVFFFHGFPGSRRDWLIFDADDSAVELNALGCPQNLYHLP